VVRGSFPDHCLIGGVPARVLRRHHADDGWRAGDGWHGGDGWQAADLDGQAADLGG